MTVEFPPTHRLLFDTVIRSAGDSVTGAMLFRVDLIDRYNDGPDVPGLIGTSPVFPSLDEAIGWAQRAITAFQQKADP